MIKRNYVLITFVALLLAVAVAGLWLAQAVAYAQDVGEGESTPLDALSDFALWSMAAGFIGTFVVAAINRQRWRSYTKFATFFIWCLVLAAVNSYFTRTLDFDNWVRSLLLVFAAGQATYLAGKPAIKEVEIATG